MKRLIVFIILLFLVLSMFGCTKNDSNEDKADTSNGPVVVEDDETVEEKVLRMIKNCIDDYNLNRIEDMETYMNAPLPELPIGITSLPEISSLDDLTQIEDDALISNATYVGYYMVQDNYRVVFKVYYPSGGYFWPNGELLFEMDPDVIEVNNPSYTTYKEALDSLLIREANILDWLYGVGVDLSYEDIQEENYYAVVSNDFTSINELKSYAESVFPKEYLENTYYKNAFEGMSPTYKEIGGKLYCKANDLTSISKNQYDTSRIIAVQEEGDTIRINLLSTIMNAPQPEIKNIRLIRSEEGYRLAEAT